MCAYRHINKNKNENGNRKKWSYPNIKMAIKAKVTTGLKYIFNNKRISFKYIKRILFQIYKSNNQINQHMK